MQTCTATNNERMASLTLEDLSRVHDLAVEAAQKDACRLLECLFPDAEIDPEKEYLLLMDPNLAADMDILGIPFFGKIPQAPVEIFGKLTIRCCEWVPKGTFYLIEDRLFQWLES